MTASNNSSTSLLKKEIICEVCHKIFKRGKDLKSHFIIHTDQKPFSCTFCPEAFKHKVSLKRHLLIHSGEKPFICQVCGKSFRQKGSLNEHSLTHTSEKPHACEVCNLGFTTKSNYVRHLRKHMSAKSFICGICGKGFNVRSYLTQHCLKAHKESNEEEDSRYENISSQNVYKIEVNNTAPDMFVASSNVSVKLPSKEVQKQCNGTKVCNSSELSKSNYSCKLCMKSSAQKSIICQPKLSHSQDVFPCSSCGSSFAKNESLQKHLKTYSDKYTSENNSKELAIESRQYFYKKSFQKQYVCSVCNKSYKKEIEYIQHSLIHKIPGPFECDICADTKQFENLHELHKHYTEHGDNICLCFFCRDSREKDIDRTSLDMNSHSIFYKCNVCHMSFNESIFLKNHSSCHKKHRPHVIKLKI